jgi:hypothetical protein
LDDHDAVRRQNDGVARLHQRDNICDYLSLCHENWCSFQRPEIKGASAMIRFEHVVITGLTVLLWADAAYAQSPPTVATAARAGAVDGTAENSDAFIWRLFTQFTAPASSSTPSPVAFETWASDADTFSTTPHWPTPGEAIRFQSSVLAAVRSPDFTKPEFSLRASTIDEPCKPPPGAAVGGFPTGGSPAPCIVEQVQRNRAQYDYIVNNKLNTQAGLAAAYAASFKVEMPVPSIAVKGDWIKLPDLIKWIPELKDIATVKKLYYTISVNAVDYALVSLHVSSRQNANWVWGTFEHQMTLGRCDYIGCFDSFGSQVPAVSPNRMVNTQYGACPKTQPLKTLMAQANLARVWENYCLKSTEVDFNAADGTPYVLGNSVIEGIVGNGTVAASSCITCHAYASYGPAGKPTFSVTKILSFNPTGSVIPDVLAGSKPFAFMWGVLLAP